MSVQPDRLVVETADGVTRVRFPGSRSLEDAHLRRVGEQLFRLAEGRGGCQLCLDFHNVDYLASNALAKLVTLQKKVQASGGRLTLCGLQPLVHEVFEVTKLAGFFDLRPE